MLKDKKQAKKELDDDTDADECENCGEFNVSPPRYCCDVCKTSGSG